MTTHFNGSFVLVLNSHLPWCLRHDALEEMWICEAISETYLPLLDAAERLIAEGRPVKYSISFTPVLCEQLAHPGLRDLFRAYCERKIFFAKKDREDFKGNNEHMAHLAGRWVDFYEKALSDFEEKYDFDVLRAFRKLQDSGEIEILTSCGTHPYLPASCEDTSIQAQVKVGVQTYEKYFGRAPKGIWLPENGYRPACRWSPPVSGRREGAPYPRKGVEEFLSENGIKYFIIDQHQLDRAWPPHQTKNPFFAYWASGPQQAGGPVAALARDSSLSLQVWRAQVGYPGDGVYLDFHKKHAEGRLRYWKVTHVEAGLGAKDLYHPDDAFDFKVKEHAGHWKNLISTSLGRNHFLTGSPGMALCAFDSELFGHWWFEGPEFLYWTLKWIDMDPEVRTETCSEYLQRQPPLDGVWLPESSWGNNYDSSTWINPELEWVLDRQYACEREMRMLAQAFLHKKDDPSMKQILQQCIRQLMLVESSDWKFMITNWSTRDNAERRLVMHLSDFWRVARMAWHYGQGHWVHEEEWKFLGDLRARCGLFEDPKIEWYAGLDVAPIA